MEGATESHRRRIAIVLIAVGMGLILLGILVVVYQAVNAPPGPPTTRAVAAPPHTRARALRQMLFWLVVLVLIFAVSTTAFLRWSRHFRRWLLRKPRPPTPSEDVWAMHKLPEGAIEEWTEPGPPDESESHGGPSPP